MGSEHGNNAGGAPSNTPLQGLEAFGTMCHDI